MMKAIPARWQHGLRTAAIVSALIVTPLAAGITAIVSAPPAHVSDVGLDGLSVDVGLELGRNTVSIDSALLGELRRPGPSVFGLDVGLSIRPSDADLVLFDSAGALDQNTIDVAGHLFSDQQAQQDELDALSAKVIRYYGSIGFGSVYFVAMLEVFGYAYLRSRRRALAVLGPVDRSLVRSELRLERRIAASATTAAALALILPAVIAVSPLSDRTVTVVPDAQLAGTFLSGWQVTGPFTGLISQAATAIDGLSKSEQAFYDKASSNAGTVLAQHFDTELATGDAGTQPNVIRLAILDDLQGTSGMARIVGEAAQQVHADGILNLGDLTATGTAQEAYLSYLKSYTIDVLAHYSGDIPVTTSLGRHDTPAVAAYAKKEHFSIADLSPQKVAGISMIGTNSPYIVNFGEAARLIDPDTTTDSVATALATKACDDRPLAVFAHDKELLDQVSATGCVPIVIGGHDYTGQPSSDVKTPQGTVARVILGSTGGHGDGDGFGGLSTPRNNAPFDILTIDRTSGALTVDTVTVHPDASVTMTETKLAALTSEQLDQLD